jgi:hypothetical protein
MGVTGIEIGPDYCVLVRARGRDTAIEVTAVRVFEAAEWGTDPEAQSALLRDARREFSLPRRASLVAWAERSQTEHSAESRSRDVGFQVESVLSPPDALALLACAPPQVQSDSAVAWVCIHSKGGALAVIRNFEILYAREFSWRIGAPEQRVQAQVLRSYLYVAQLASEIRCAVKSVREEHGSEIESAVACGTLPDLRSLTMPLIRELDLEVETLDSSDGLHSEGEVATVVAQNAAAIRLASAAAVYGATVGRKKGRGKWLGVAAALMLGAVAAWWTFSTGAASKADVDQPAEAPAATSTRSSPPSDTVGTSPPPVPAPKQPQRPQPTMGVVGRERPEGESSVQPLADPLPSVGGVLISGDRRLAVVDGSVVGIGDRIGARTVAGIDPDAVILREPSGRQIRVPIRTKVGTS